MKKCILILSALLFVASGDEDPKIDSLLSFAKVYGYVKYFHPSDEAAKINWNSFAAYGAQEMLKCEKQSDIIPALRALFEPIAPSIHFSEEMLDYDLEVITPENIDGYFPVYWQHLGVTTGMNSSDGPYSSVRVNGAERIDESASFGNLMLVIDPEKYIGKEVKYSGWVKLHPDSDGTGHLWMRVDQEDETRCFFDNMGDNPIKSSDWTRHEIVTKICDNSSELLLGSFVNGKGTLYLDDVQLHFKENGEWIEIPIMNGGFEADQVGTKTENSKWFGNSKGYSYKLSSTEEKEGEKCAVIQYRGITRVARGETIFESFPKFGELIEEEIGENIYCQVPLNLYANETNTFPQGSSSELEKELRTVSGRLADLHIRLGNVINTYSVFQHFYPYFDVVEVDWDEELRAALKNSFRDEAASDHLVTLRKFTAPLKDGHIFVTGPERDVYVPPIHWEWLEDKLIITEVFEEDLGVEVGDEVTRVGDVSAREHFEEINSRISAGTEGWLHYRSQSMSLVGEKNSEIDLEIDDKVVALKRIKKYGYEGNKIEIQRSKYRVLENDIYYLNLNTIEMDTITSLLPQLRQSNGIICDLRGYPNGNHGFISHLLSHKDTSTAWMNVPKIIYPDQNKILGYETFGWELEPKEPFLGDNAVVFMIDGSSISYAESYMSFIEGYKLGTIIGQPTAGANGNINPFTLIGNCRISWTGMKVLKHDGSQHHAIGVLPDTYVHKTIEGVLSGRDEFLEKAIEIVLKE